ncbi:hypothetical protein J6590_063183 [Homalodisca vitripennis]|nr:hypothetical protein J6590_063183 [Homalodisca vitripennis]
MYLDKDLTWSNHVDYFCARVTSGIYALRNPANLHPANSYNQQSYLSNNNEDAWCLGACKI